MDDEYVRVNVKLYRELVKAAARRVKSMPATNDGVDKVRAGTASGCHLALSFLDECVERD